MMQGVILAAGKGKRLKPLSDHRSKAMMPVLGTPLVGRVVESLQAGGIQDFIAVVSPDDQPLRDYLQSIPGAQFQFAVQHERLGMGHALSLAKPLLHSRFVLSACDSFCPHSFLKDFTKTLANELFDAVLSLIHLSDEDVESSGVVTMQGSKITFIVEKPKLAEAPSRTGSLPLYGFSTKLLPYLDKIAPSPRGEYELQSAIQMMIADQLEVHGLVSPERLQVTTPNDLKVLTQYFLDLSPAMSRVPSGCRAKFLPPVVVEEGAVIGDGVTIGPSVYVEKGVVIGDNCQISDSVLLNGTRIESENTIQDAILPQ